jgi:hypothetical protein
MSTYCLYQPLVMRVIRALKTGFVSLLVLAGTVVQAEPVIPAYPAYPAPLQATPQLMAITTASARARPTSLMVLPAARRDLVIGRFSAGDFMRMRVSPQLRVRGWKLSNKVYFGQAKVGNRWGVGFLVEHKDYVYGVNHRGIQLMRRF